MKKFLFFLLYSFPLISCLDENLSKQSISEINPCILADRNDSISLSEELIWLKDSIKNKTGVYVLEDGGNSLLTRAWLCLYAESTIDIQYFIFSADNVGLIACDFLVKAADRGVKVRILVDDIMVDARLEDLLILNSHKNISIKIYNPGVNLGKNLFGKIKKFTSDFRSANQRMHNKTFIVDKKIIITGGRNIADEYFDYDHEYNFRDRDVLLLGKASEMVQHSFEQFWESYLSHSVTSLSDYSNFTSTDDQFNKLHQYACNPENFSPQVRNRINNLHFSFKEIRNSSKLVWVNNVQFVSDHPGKNDGKKGLSGGGICTDSLINLIKRAKKSIDIQSPYFITTELGQKLFKQAINKGIKVRILTNSLASTDNVEAFSGYQRDRNKLLNLGIKIFEFKPDAAIRHKVMTGELQNKANFAPIFGLHAKTMVIDDNITVIGTFNLDPRSANLNTECIAIIYSEIIAKQVMKGIEEEFRPENAWETTLNFNPDSFAGKSKTVKNWTRKIIPKNIL